MACARHRVSERRACRVLGQARTTQRYERRVREDEGPLRARECLAIVVARRLQSKHVLECLSGLFGERGTPVYIRSDNGPEFTAAAVRKWLGQVGVGTLT